MLAENKKESSIYILGEEFRIICWTRTITITEYDVLLLFKGAMVARLCVYMSGYQKGVWYLNINNIWDRVSEPNKSKTVKAIVLDYILTNFNKITTKTDEKSS